MIRNNPFNILGLLAGAPEKEIARRKAQINAYLNVGKEISFPEDIPMASEGLERTPETLAQAMAAIDQYSNRALNGLSWFADGGRADGPALAHLRDGDHVKARDIWFRVASAGPITAQTISSCSNLGTLDLLKSAAEGDGEVILAGLQWKMKMFGSEHFPEMLTRISDVSVAKDLGSIKAKWAEHLAAWLIPSNAGNGEFMKKLGAMFDTEADPIRSRLRKPFVSHYEREVERLLNSCQTARKRTARDADRSGTAFLNNSRPLLGAFRAFSGIEDIGYQHAADQVAEELLECAIQHFNATVDADEVQKTTVRSLVKFAGLLAHGRMLKARISDNQKGMNEYFDEENEREQFKRIKPIMDKIEYQILLLERNATGMEPVSGFVANCTSLLDTLGTALGRTEVLFVNVSSSVVNKALQRLINVVNSAQTSGMAQSDGAAQVGTVIKQAKELMDRMGTMTMHPDLRKRFDENARTLHGWQMSSPRAAATPAPLDPTVAWIKEKAVIVAIILLVGFLLSQC